MHAGIGDVIGGEWDRSESSCLMGAMEKEASPVISGKVLFSSF